MTDYPGLNDDFRDLIVAFADAAVEHLVVDAHAMAVHGVPRATGDFDVWVRPTAANAARVMAALHAFGAPVDYAMTPLLHSCAPGLVCVDNGMGVGDGFCYKWCTPTGQQSQCSASQTCTAFPLPIIQNGTEYGVCF